LDLLAESEFVSAVHTAYDACRQVAGIQQQLAGTVAAACASAGFVDSVVLCGVFIFVVMPIACVPYSNPGLASLRTDGAVA
jgi:hypothetical protein